MKFLLSGYHLWFSHIDFDFCVFDINNFAIFNQFDLHIWKLCHYFWRPCYTIVFAMPQQYHNCPNAGPFKNCNRETLNVRLALSATFEDLDQLPRSHSQPIYRHIEWILDRFTRSKNLPALSEPQRSFLELYTQHPARSEALFWGLTSRHHVCARMRAYACVSVRTGAPLCECVHMRA